MNDKAAIILSYSFFRRSMSTSSKCILVAIADGSEELETIGIVNPLRRAGNNVFLASISTLIVTCARGTKIQADDLLDNLLGNDFDAIILPGGIPGANNLSGKISHICFILCPRRHCLTHLMAA